MQQAASIPCIPRSLRFFFGKEDSSVAKMLLSEWVCSSELVGVSRASFCEGKSSSFCPFRFRRAGLMSGRRYRKEPELEVTEPATDGAGEGMREGAQLPDSREKCSAMETSPKRKWWDYNPNTIGTVFFNNSMRKGNRSCKCPTYLVLKFFIHSSSHTAKHGEIPHALWYTQERLRLEMGL